MKFFQKWISWIMICSLMFYSSLQAGISVASAANAGNIPQNGKSKYVPGQIIVELKKGKKFSSPILVLLNQKFKTTSITQVASSKEKQKSEALKKKYPRRAARIPQGIEIPDLSNLYVLQIDPNVDPQEAAQEYQGDSADVLAASANPYVDLASAPSDPYYNSQNSWGQGYDDQWGLKKIDVEKAWTKTKGKIGRAHV